MLNDTSIPAVARAIVARIEFNGTQKDRVMTAARIKKQSLAELIGRKFLTERFQRELREELLELGWIAFDDPTESLLSFSKLEIVQRWPQLNMVSWFHQMEEAGFYYSERDSQVLAINRDMDEEGATRPNRSNVN